MIRGAVPLGGPISLLKKSRSDDKEAAAPRGGRRKTKTASKATSAAGGGRYAQFFNGLLGALPAAALRAAHCRQAGFGGSVRSLAV